MEIRLRTGKKLKGELAYLGSDNLEIRRGSGVTIGFRNVDLSAKMRVKYFKRDYATAQAKHRLEIEKFKATQPDTRLADGNSQEEVEALRF